jgi:serine/threonine protein phosphatase PrpC
MEAAIKVLPMTGQDRAMATPVPGGYLVALADGAGGTGNGAVAAERLMTCVAKLAQNAASSDWFEILCEFDYELSTGRSGGETTGVIALINGVGVRGASVGDSAAWLISTSGAMVDMTARQRRRPMLGSGEALPVEFEADHRGSRILLASDGLIKYAPADQVCAIAMRGSATEAANELANCVRLPSGAFHDDVAVIIVSE